MLEALEKIHDANIRPERRRREGRREKKGNARPSSPFLWFNLFSVFFSFLFVQIFPCGQVDKLLGMSHGAISPSLMVLFWWKVWNLPSCDSKISQNLSNIFIRVNIERGFRPNKNIVKSKLDKSKHVKQETKYK